MKDQGSATKLVLRRLPPGISEDVLRAQIDSRFHGRYNWFSFRPARTSLSHGANHRPQLFSRAYIQMRMPQDVFEFADVFNGHVFVDEKGNQFKTTVEYAPYQGVPDSSRKDLREGTIEKDVKYLEFLEMISKPIENLPSAEIQLERKETERAGASKDDIVVTPLMEFIRQKRAVKSGTLRLSSSSRKSGGRARGASAAVNKRGSERSKSNNAMYVLRDSMRTSSNKEKAANVLVQQKEQQQSRENEILMERNKKDSTNGKDQHNSTESDFSLPSCIELVGGGAVTMKNLQDPRDNNILGGNGSGEVGKRQFLLSKDRDKEFANGPSGRSPSLQNIMDIGVQVYRRQTSSFKGAAQQAGNVISSGKGASGTVTFKQNPRSETSGRAGRGVLLTKDPQLSVALPKLEQQNQMSHFEKDKRPPRHPGIRSSLKDHSSVDVESRNFHDERQDRRTKNKDRPDRPVWTPRRRSDGSSIYDASQPLSESVMKFQSPPEGSWKIEKMERSSTSRQKVGFAEKVVEDSFHQGDLSSNLMDLKTDYFMASGDVEGQGSARTVLATGENGNPKQILRRPSASVTKEADGTSILGESKPAKRGAAVGHGGQEKQVWVAVQKSGSCS